MNRFRILILLIFGFSFGPAVADQLGEYTTAYNAPLQSETEDHYVVFFSQAGTKTWVGECPSHPFGLVTAIVDGNDPDYDIYLATMIAASQNDSEVTLVFGGCYDAQNFWLRQNIVDKITLPDLP